MNLLKSATTYNINRPLLDLSFIASRCPSLTNKQLAGVQVMTSKAQSSKSTCHKEYT